MDTDTDIAAWILEFLLRHQINHKLINTLLLSLPSTDTNNRLKKTLLLQKLESDISNASVSETTLDLLETIEELDHREGKTASDLLKQAYCRVAVDCVARYLNVNDGKYSEAVERVWKTRVCKMESLGSEELEWWMGEIGLAGSDSGACERVLMRNTRNCALKSVRVYLREGWGSLGPTFLDSVAGEIGDLVERICVGVQNETDQATFAQNQITIKNKRRRGAMVSDADEGDENEPRNKKENTLIPGVDSVQTEPETGSTEQDANAVSNILPKDHQTAQVPSSVTEPNNHNPKTQVNQTGPGMIATPDIDIVRKALKSSFMELRAAVRDPLPDAIQTAINVSRPTPISNVNGDETVAVDQTRPETHAPREETMKNKSEDARGNESQNGSKLGDISRRSLMDPSGTAHTFEWDDSIDSLSEGSPSSPPLHNPKETKCFLVKNHDNFGKSKRRTRKMWSPEEEETLRTAVKRFGLGRWKVILDSYPEVFKDRTNENLKDKWRTMTR